VKGATFVVAKKTRALNSKKLASVSHNAATNEIDTGVVLTALGKGGWLGGTEQSCMRN